VVCTLPILCLFRRSIGAENKRKKQVPKIGVKNNNAENNRKKQTEKTTIKLKQNENK